ncbi:hypothetical protein ABIA32_000969 [Streptacidiphilus sp. MAP12-20]|uniref:hypothetical protein n=1 Tax=Streptacidiphilus sp. MAP12-20 TaxID=3156299 RepID=UPI0035165464
MLLLLGALWALGAWLTSRCGARTRVDGSCQNPGKGWLVRCHLHGFRLLTASDLGGAALALVGYLLVMHHHTGGRA